MVLMLREDVRFGIGIRALANSLEAKLNTLESDADFLEQQYVKKAIDVVSTTIIEMNVRLRLLEEDITDLGYAHVHVRLNQEQQKLHESLGECARVLIQRTQNRQTVEDEMNLLIADMYALSEIQFDEFVLFNNVKKAEAVAELGEIQPTFAKVSSVLRVEEIQNQQMLSEAQGALRTFVTNYIEELVEWEAEGADIELWKEDKKRYFIQEEAFSKLQEYYYNYLEPILVNNPERETFLKDTLANTLDNFLSKNEETILDPFNELVDELKGA